jgi:tyrosinase
VLCRVRNPDYPLDEVDKLLEATMPNVEAWMAQRAGNTNNCTLENAAVRREWYAAPTVIAVQGPH